MSEIKKIPARSELAVEDTWAIEDLYPSDESWEAELDSISKNQVELSSYAGRLGESGQTLYDFLYLSEMTNVTLSRLANYCMRKADEDTRNSTYQAMYGKFMSFVVALGAACSFETPEIMAIPDEQLEQFYADCPALERYRRSLTNERRMKEHTLSPAEEKLLAASGDMGSLHAAAGRMIRYSKTVDPDPILIAPYADIYAKFVEDVRKNYGEL